MGRCFFFCYNVYLSSGIVAAQLDPQNGSLFPARLSSRFHRNRHRAEIILTEYFCFNSSNMNTYRIDQKDITVIKRINVAVSFINIDNFLSNVDRFYLIYHSSEQSAVGLSGWVQLVFSRSFFSTGIIGRVRSQCTLQFNKES